MGLYYSMSLNVLTKGFFPFVSHSISSCKNCCFFSLQNASEPKFSPQALPGGGAGGYGGTPPASRASHHLSHNQSEPQFRLNREGGDPVPDVVPRINRQTPDRASSHEV